MIAVVWHFWIAPFLLAGALLGIVATIVGYLKFVTAQQYPPRGKNKK